MCDMMVEAVVTLPTLYLFDTRLGGWIHRERGITFFEAPALRDVLPSWVVTVPSDTLRPQEISWMDPVEQVGHTVRHGVFRLASGSADRHDIMQSQVPVVIGWLQWGGPSTALQAGIIVSIGDAQWKVQDVSRRGSSQL